MSIPGLTAPVDTALRSFWKKNANVAEVFTKAFDLREPIKPELLQERDSVESAVLEQSKGRYLTLYGNRDTLRFLPMGEEEAKKGVLLAIENQSWIDHQMPLRLLRYDLISYASQASYLWNHQMEEKGTNDVDESERLSRFRKDDQIHAVVTLVIYYGKEPWEKPLSLKTMFEEPGDQLSGFANDYPFRLIDVRRLGKEQIEAFAGEVKALFGFVRYSEEWEILPVFVETNRDVFQTLSMEATVAILKVTKSRKLNQYLKKWKKEEEKKAGETGKEAFNMCKALDDMCEHAKAEGEREGRIAGEREGRIAGEREGRIAGEREGRIAGEREGRIAGEREGRIAGEREGRIAGEREGRIVGERIGINKGETMLAQLIRKLLADNRSEEIKKAALDRMYRKKLYRFYGIG